MLIMPLSFPGEAHWMIFLCPVQNPQHLNHINEEQCRHSAVSRQSKPYENCLLFSKLPDHRFKTSNCRSKPSSLMPRHRMPKKQSHRRAAVSHLTTQHPSDTTLIKAKLFYLGDRISLVSVHVITFPLSSHYRVHQQD